MEQTTVEEIEEEKISPHPVEIRPRQSVEVPAPFPELPVEMCERV